MSEIPVAQIVVEMESWRMIGERLMIISYVFDHVCRSPE